MSAGGRVRDVLLGLVSTLPPLTYQRPVNQVTTWFLRGERRASMSGFHVLSVCVLLGATAGIAAAQGPYPHKRIVPVARPHGPTGESQDFGDVAVLVDNGLMVTRQNPLDLAGRMVRFEPAGDHLYKVSSPSGVLDPDIGSALTFGYPGATEFP